MCERWIQESKIILDELKKLENTEGQDRLDMVRMIRFTLYALQRSVSGWLEWVNNPDIMASFSSDELKEINTNLAKLTHPFVEYDSNITARTKRELTLPEKPKTSKKKVGKQSAFYIE